MAYEDEGGSPGSVPELGAIFMSNCATKKECLRRKLLGLPSAQANFVKRVKAGMILFLFEFEKRELYGVYQASSDGAMNIVPHAFDSSGKQFPAQVRFTVIWYCKPLSEYEFRDAISENYYSKKKFNFGLSEHQVRRLLYLFNLRKPETRLPQRQFGGLTSLSGKERILGNEKVNKINRLKFVEEDGPAYTINTDYSADSPSNSQRPDNKRFAENTPGYDTLTEHEGRVFGRRKRAAEDSMDLIQDKLDFNYDERTGYSRPVDDGDLRESLYSSRRLGKENQPFYRDTVETEDIRDALTHIIPGGFLTRAGRDLHDDIGQMRDIRESKHSQGDDGLRLRKRVESIEIPQTELRRPIYDQRLFMDQKVDYDHSPVGGPKSTMSMIQSDENFLARARRDLNDGRVQMKGIRGDGHSPSEDCFMLGKGTECFEIPQTELRRPIDDQRLFMDQKVEYDHNSVGCPNSISTNRVSNCLPKVRRTPDDYEQIHIRRSVDNGITQVASDRLDKVRRVADDRKQFRAEQFTNCLDYGGKLNYQESLTNVDDGHPLDRIKQLDDKRILRKSDRSENAYDMGNNLGMPMSMGYTDAYQTRQQEPSFKSSNPKLQAHYSPSQSQHKTSLFPSSMEQRMYATSYPTSFTMENKYGVSNPTSSDAVLTRSVPYDPDFPDVNVTSHLVKDFNPYHNRVGNDIAISKRKSPYYTEAENLSSQSDGSLPCVSDVPMHDNKDLYDQYDGQIFRSFLSGGYREKMEQPSITNEICEDTLPFSRSHVHDKLNMSPSIEFNEQAVASNGRVNHKFQGNVTDPASSDFQDLLVKYGMGHANLGSSVEIFNDYGIGASQEPDVLPKDSKNRTSVFARLSLPSRKHEPENEGYMEQEELDASVDEVMETVYDFLSQKITKTKTQSPLSKRHNKEGTLGTKRQAKRPDQKQDDEPATMTRDMVIECKQASNDDENADYLLKETRVVEFKRRSEISRTQNGVKSAGSAQKSEGKGEGMEECKPLKRRKLIRPVFGQKEKLNDDSKGDVLSNLQLTNSKHKGAGCNVSDTKLGNPKSQSLKSQFKKLVGPVFSENEKLNVLTGDVDSNLQITSSKNEVTRCEFSATNLENPNSISPKSGKKLVRPPFVEKEESNGNSKSDGVSDLHLLSTHESSNNQKAATCEFADKNLGISNGSSPTSGSLGSKPPSGSVDITELL